jgi:hypothetical protein
MDTAVDMLIDELSAIRTPQAIPSATVEAGLLVGAIRAVLPAVSKDVSRPHLASVNIEVAEGRCVVAATDGHRIHEVSFSATGTLTVTITRQCAESLTKSITGTCTITKRSIEWNGDNMSLSRIDGAFPPYKRCIPTAKRKAGPAVGLFPAHMADVHKATSALGFLKKPNAGQGVTLSVGGELDAVLITGTTHDFDLRIVIMPMRI